MLRDGSRGNPLVIHEDSNREIYVEGLSEFRVRSMDECLALLRIGASFGPVLYTPTDRQTGTQGFLANVDLPSCRRRGAPRHPRDAHKPGQQPLPFHLPAGARAGAAAR